MANKTKQKEFEFEVNVWLLISLCLLVFIFFVISIEQMFIEANNACEKAGYEKYLGGFPSYCSDKDGNYHPIELTCTNFPLVNCNVKNIKIID